MEKSKTDLALIEEASRYGNVLNFKGTLVSGLSPPLCFFHGRTPEREYYDYSGAVCEAGQGETPLCMLNVRVSRRVKPFLGGSWWRQIMVAV